MPVKSATIVIVPSRLGAETVALKFPAESVMWDGIFMGLTIEGIG